jgi:hypothetical protein
MHIRTPDSAAQCVHWAGVDLNTASEPLLQHVGGEHLPLHLPTDHDDLCAPIMMISARHTAVV